MRILAVSEVGKKIVESVDNSIVNEEGLLPVFDIEYITEKEMKTACQNSLSESDKTVIIGDAVLPCISAFSAPESGVIAFSARPCLREMVEKGLLKKEYLIIVGIRTWSSKELSFLNENKIKFYPMKEIIAEGIHETSDSVMSAAKDFSQLYVYLDLSVLDPSCAPGTYCPEPGGLTARELFFFINRLNKMKNLKITHLDGLNMNKDMNNATLKIASKIVTELY